MKKVSPEVETVGESKRTTGLPGSLATIKEVNITQLNLNNRREKLTPGGLLYAQGISRSQAQVSGDAVGFQLGHAASAWNFYHLGILQEPPEPV